jgi:hypothetical protein
MAHEVGHLGRGEVARVEVAQEQVELRGLFQVAAPVRRYQAAIAARRAARAGLRPPSHLRHTRPGRVRPKWLTRSATWAGVRWRGLRLRRSRWSFAVSGDPAVADAIRGLAGRYSSVLLANHGPVVAGDTLEARIRP